MRPSVRVLSEEERRTHQRSIGLTIEPISAAKQKRNDTIMETQNAAPAKASRAERVLKHLAEPPTYKELVVYELKKASVYVPIIAGTALGVLWMNKRFFVKAVTRA